MPCLQDTLLQQGLRWQWSIQHLLLSHRSSVGCCASLCAQLTCFSSRIRPAATCTPAGMSRSSRGNANAKRRTGPQLVAGLPCYKGNMCQILLGYSLAHICQSAGGLSKVLRPFTAVDREQLAAHECRQAVLTFSICQSLTYMTHEPILRSFWA